MTVDDLVVALAGLSPPDRAALVAQLIERGLARHAAAVPDRSSCVELAPEFFAGMNPAPDPELAPDPNADRIPTSEHRPTGDEQLPFSSVLSSIHNCRGWGSVRGKDPCAGGQDPRGLLLLWNQTVRQLPKAYALTRFRERRARDRLREFPDLDWTAAIRRIDASPFCTGVNSLGWRADFDFFLRPTTIPKLLEGTYDRRRPVERKRAEPPSPASTRAYFNRLFGSESNED